MVYFSLLKENKQCYWLGYIFTSTKGRSINEFLIIGTSFETKLGKVSNETTTLSEKVSILMYDYVKKNKKNNVYVHK